MSKYIIDNFFLNKKKIDMSEKNQELPKYFSLYGYPSYPRYNLENIGFNIKLNEITYGSPKDGYERKLYAWLIDKEDKDLSSRAITEEEFLNFDNLEGLLIVTILDIPIENYQDEIFYLILFKEKEVTSFVDFIVDINKMEEELNSYKDEEIKRKENDKIISEKLKIGNYSIMLERIQNTYVKNIEWLNKNNQILYDYHKDIEKIKLDERLKLKLFDKVFSIYHDSKKKIIIIDDLSNFYHEFKSNIPSPIYCLKEYNLIEKDVQIFKEKNEDTMKIFNNINFLIDSFEFQDLKDLIAKN